MKIIATRHLNLHTKKVDGGLVHVPAKQARLVPDDVVDHPLFKRLVSSGTVVVLKGKKAPEALPVKQNTLPEENPIKDEDTTGKEESEGLGAEDDLDELIASDEEEAESDEDEDEEDGK